MEEISANKLDENDTDSEQQITIDQAFVPSEDDSLDDRQTINNKTNGSNKLTANKPVPLILKRNRTSSNDKLDCSSESNENIDDNKKRKVIELRSVDEDNTKTKELVQRSSSRKKTKKSFGSDFLHLDRTQFSNKQTYKKHRPKNCAYCLKNDGEIHHCKFCRLRGHENCFQSNSGVSRDGYKNKVVICSQCRHCEMCEEKNGQLFFCSRCNSVFHRLCDSNLSLILKPIYGKWQCSFCDTLDSLVGDSLTEEQRKKEIQRRKLLVMRKRLRKSDYVLEDGLCSIQQVVNQAVQKRKNDVDLTDQDFRNEIDLSDDELDTSKHILNETKETDFWLDDLSIDFIRLEEFLKKQRKNYNILSKQIKEDKKYFTLVKVFIDRLKDDEFKHTKKDQFMKELSSESFKRSFFEHNSLNGVTKSSIFIDALIKTFEKSLQIEYWKPRDVDDPISQQDYFTSQTKNNKEDKPNNLIIKINRDEIKQGQKIEEENESNVGRVDQFNNKIIDSPKLKTVNCSEEVDLILSLNKESKISKEILADEKTTVRLEEKDEMLNSNNSDPIINEPPLDEQKNVLNEPDPEFDLVNELMCEEPNLAELSDEESNISTKCVEETIFNQESKLMNIDVLDEIDLNEGQSVLVKDDLFKKDLLDDNLIENVPDKSDKSSYSTENINAINDLSVKEIDTVLNKSSNEQVNDETSKHNMQENENDKDKDSETDKNNSNENNSNENNSNKDNSSEDRSNEDNSNENNLNRERLNDHSANSVKSVSKSNESDEVESTNNKSKTSPLENRPTNEMNPKVIKTNKKIIKKKIKSNKRKFKIKSSNNLVDKLFKRACKYNLSLLEPKYWTSEDVSIYLKQIGFENEAQNFKEKSIDGKSLLKLSRQEVLTNFGIKLGKAVKIYAYLNDLQVKNKCNISFD